MSGYGPIFVQPTITSYDLSASAASVQALANNTSAGFSIVSAVIGNTNGLDSTSTENINNSIAASLGNLPDVSPEEPYNVAFSGYTDTFAHSTTNKEYVLTLVPNLASSFVITSPGDASVWNRVSTVQNLANPGDYVVNGKSLIFYKQPTVQFTATYTGNYPEHGGGLYDGYLPNIYPDPATVVARPAIKPIVTTLSSTTYRVDFVKSNQNNRSQVFGANLTLEYNPVILPYVSAITLIAAPLDFVAIWCKSASTSNFFKLNCSIINLRSSTQIQFTTTDTFDPTNDIICLVISNISIGTMLRAVNQLLANHTHDRYGSTPLLSHNNLRDLIPVSNKTGVVYGGSTIPDNDHPQYIHREGFQVSDPGTYGNAMLGDFLVGSTVAGSDKTFNNITADSNRVVFGSISNGGSIKYSQANNSLFLWSAGNGLYINSLHTGSAGKESYALNLGGLHQLFNYNISGTDYLAIGSPNLRTYFTDLTGVNLADIFARKAFLTNLDVTNAITIEPTGSLTIGTVVWQQTTEDSHTGVLVSSPTNTNAFIDTQVDTLFNKSTTTTGNIVTGNISGVLNILNGANISFGTADSSPEVNQMLTITLTSGSITEYPLIINNKYPVRFFNTGRRTGVSFGDTITDEYASIYAASPSGSPSSISSSDTYFEGHTGGIYFLKTTNQNVTVNGTTYAWQQTVGGTTRVDTLPNWPQAPIFAYDGNFSGELNVTGPTILSGTTTMSGQLNLNGPLVSTAGGSFTGALAIATANVNTLNVSGPAAFNGPATFAASFILNNNLTVNGILTLNGQFVQSGASFSVGGIATFASTLTVSNNLTAQQSIFVGSGAGQITLDNTGVAIIPTLTVTGSAGIQNLSAGGNTTLSGNISLAGSQVHNGADPTSPQDLATMAWVLSQVSSSGGSGALVDNGHWTFPGGIIVQWGHVIQTMAEQKYSFSFPITFPNKCLVIIPTLINNSNDVSADLWAQWDQIDTTASTGWIFAQYDGNFTDRADGFAWFAVGF